VALKAPTAVICLSPYAGGMEMDAIRLAKKLSVHTPVTLIAKEGCFIASKREEYAGYNGIVPETVSFKKSLSLPLILSIRKLVEKHQIKNVIFFGASELKSLYFAFLGHDITLIVRHGTTKAKPKKDWFHRLVYSNVAYHVSICKHLQQNVCHIFPFGKNTKEKVIYSSFEFHDTAHRPTDRLTLLHVGRIAEGKGQLDAIRACETLIENNIDFTFNIVGGFDDTYKNAFMDVYEQCPYKANINLVGFSDNVNAYMQSSDIFLFPSYGEGLSNAFLEALASGLVCIAYDNTSFPELRQMGLFFEMCPDRDVDALKETLLVCARELETKRQNVQKNLPLVQEIFSLENEVNAYLQILSGAAE
jgi:glycosyltransferase involved in cell wall biosynthesis